MKPFVISLLAITVLAGSVFADDTKRAVVPGTDDIIRYVAARATPGGQITLRDASGRTVGTASTVGTQTTFRDGSGRTTGSATIAGNGTVFRDASGRMLGTATTSRSQTITYRDATGRF